MEGAAKGGRLFIKGAAGIRNAGKNTCGVAIELVTFVGQRKPTPVTVEERDAQIALEVLDGVGHCRLRNGKIVRRAGDRPGLANGYKVLQLPECESQEQPGIVCAIIKAMTRWRKRNWLSNSARLAATWLFAPTRFLAFDVAE